MGQTDKTSINLGTYKDWDSVIIENQYVRVELLPKLGGKLVSIVYKPTSKEWMLSSGRRPLQQPIYRTSLTDWDMSGWDECFPTILSCPSGTKEEIMLPGHGELWAIPWTYALEGSAVVCTARSPQLSYTFTRRISLQSPDRILIEYKVDNTGGEELPFLWVPHPQFSITEPTRILLPPSGKKMLCVDGGKSLRQGENYDWDDVSLLTTELKEDGVKFYYPGKVSAGWSGLHGLESDDFLILSVSPDKVPYIGVWIDTGKFYGRVTCAIEPGIGYYDSLATAMGNGTEQRIPPKGSAEWHLEIIMGNGSWERVTSNL